MRMKKLFFASCVFFASLANGRYAPPRAKVEPLEPRGIRISIPHEPGITLVAFHVKFNEDFQGLEAGTIARDIVQSQNERWTYEDRTTELKIGDVIYYWIHVIYKGLGYNLLFQQHQVTEFFSAENGKTRKKGTKNPADCLPTDTRLIRPEINDDLCSGQLLLDENFDNFNETLWTRVERFTSSPDYAFVIYRNDERNVKCQNGFLEINPTRVRHEYDRDFIRCGNLTLEKCTGRRGSMDCHREALGPYILPPIFSGLIKTEGTLVFTYGKIEIRAKLPKGDWIYPILRLERPTKEAPSSSSNHAQLSVAASTGNVVLRGPNGDDIGGHVLRGGSTVTNSTGGQTVRPPNVKSSRSLWSDDFHVYELEWGRRKIVSRVDGVEYGSTETGPPFDKPFYLVLGVAVGGHDEFPDSAMSDGYAKPWRNVGSKALFDFSNAADLWSKTWNDDSTRLKIDYVKVWAL